VAAEGLDHAAPSFGHAQERTDMSTGAALDVERLTMRFGGLTALSEVSFRARAADVTAVIGPNGAGKTTLFNCLSGFYRPTAGQLRLSAEGGNRFRLERMSAYRIAREARVIRTFQTTRLFAGMSVLENLVVAQHADIVWETANPMGALLALPRHRFAMRKASANARHWLHRLELLDVADRPASSLPYGSQRRLEIARAMCARPSLLCLDEPAAGLNPRESYELTELLLEIRRHHDVTMLLIEHDMSVVMRVSDHVVVLDHGVLIAEGPPAVVRSDAAVIRAYLGPSPGEEMKAAAK
jgi:branched-chain amino acid transport system ATP-binding protein